MPRGRVISLNSWVVLLYGMLIRLAWRAGYRVQQLVEHHIRGFRLERISPDTHTVRQLHRHPRHHPRKIMQLANAIAPAFTLVHYSTPYGRVLVQLEREFVLKLKSLQIVTIHMVIGVTARYGIVSPED